MGEEAGGEVGVAMEQFAAPQSGDKGSVPAFIVQKAEGGRHAAACAAGRGASACCRAQAQLPQKGSYPSWHWPPECTRYLVAYCTWCDCTDAHLPARPQQHCSVLLVTFMEPLPVLKGIRFGVTFWQSGRLNWTVLSTVR